MKVKLIPALEIPITRGLEQPITPQSKQHFWQNPGIWEVYQQRVLATGGYADYARVLPGGNFVHIDNWSTSDLRKLVQAHLSADAGGQSVPPAESCALFGGFVLTIEEVPVLGPQCCGTLADIAGWLAVTSPQFTTGYFCIEGHPAPHAARHGQELWILCAAEDERFTYPALPKIVVESQALATAVSVATQRLQAFATRLNLLSTEFGVARLSDYLVYTAE